uniref:Uncharacterized protein n=1 Tax=Arion vulgaris TaxID=1028688 RepID=A0A0B7B1T3_9EUPU
MSALYHKLRPGGAGSFMYSDTYPGKLVQLVESAARSKTITGIALEVVRILKLTNHNKEKTPVIKKLRDSR